MDDGVEVDGGAVDVGEGRVGLVEEEREVGAGDEDGVDGIAGAEGLGERGELGVLGFGAAAVAQEFPVDRVDEVDFGRGGLDELDVGEQTEEP